MKRRFTSLMLIFGMIFNTAVPTLAKNGSNAYGHSVTYEPITQLYTGGEAVKFFDAQTTEWGKLENSITGNEANSIRWLSENNYLLNRFGRYFSGDKMSGCFNSKGEWQSQMKGARKVRRWDGNISFNALTDKAERENGNIENIYNKGDIQYFFSWKVKTVQTRWGLWDKSNDTGQTFIFGEMTDSSGGSWKKYNTLSDGPNLFYSSAWKSADKLKLLSFTAKSDKDANVDSYLSGAMLVGRDIKGPVISSVRVTSDIDGKNELENGAVTLDTIDKLDNRTVYFQVQWDEPVILNMPDIEKLSLNIETIGADGTSGLIAEAPFLKFAPSKKDAKPTMVFEYKIADPYTDSSGVTQERGYFYKFSKVTVSQSENKSLWNNIYDISGNKFAADSNGQQPAGKISVPVSGSVCVDLMPFAIKNIRMTKSSEDASAFIRNGDLLAVTVELNKPMTGNTDIESLPKITLNIEDPDGNDVVIKPQKEDLRKKYYYPSYNEWREMGYFWVGSQRIRTAEPSADRTAITYYVQLYDGYKMKNGTSVKVTEVSENGTGIKDSRGYSLLNYALNEKGELSPINIHSGAKSRLSDYTVSPDKQYKLDYDAPITGVSASDEGDGVIMITADADDISLDGCEASFTVNINGRTDGEAVCYQASAYPDYNDSQWINGEMNISFGAPIVNKKAYGFIKLPQKSEADKINISVTVSDEAGNSSSAQKILTSPEWNGIDTLAPSVNAEVEQDDIIISLTDMDDAAAYEYGFGENDTDEPTYVRVDGKEGIISAPALPDESLVYTRVAWIRASDSKGNKSEPVKLTMKYDRTYTKVSYTADTDKMYTSEDAYPSADVVIENAVRYWYVWAEKPANQNDTAGYIADNFLSDMKSRAESIGKVIELPPKGEDEDRIHNQSDFNAALTADTVCAGINADSESYGENIAVNETSRPLMLVIGAEKEDGTTLVKTVEFNTFYSAPKAAVRQNRFSTNNSTGKRIDYIREKGSLIWPDDEYENPINTPALYGFMQAEIRLVGDPVTKLERVDIPNSTITLKRVVYSGESIASSTVVNEWNMGGLDFTALADGTMSAVINIDPKSVDTQYYEVDEDEVYNIVRYEFEYTMAYKNGIQSTTAPVAYFAFNNNPSAVINSTVYYRESYYGGTWESTLNDMERYGDKTNIEAVFDENGNDITPNIPVYTTQVWDSSKIYVRFGAPLGDEGFNCDKAYYSAPALNNTSKLAVHIGTDPNNLSETLPFTANAYDILSEPYLIGENLLENEDEIFEKTLYYRFEFPEREEMSPVYVMKIRRDNVDPVFDITISETTRKTNEVLMKINSVYDVQTAPDGTVVTDTPENVLIDYMRRYRGDDWLYAWRYAAENDDLSAIPEENIREYTDYDEETGELIPVYMIKVIPDENGIYHFTSNGYFSPDTDDYAGNRSHSSVINGEHIELENNDYLIYEITNIDTKPPKFINTPTFTEHDGSFVINAKADETAENVYLKFDKAYKDFLSENNPEEIMYNIENIPGAVSAEFNRETGEISAEIYAKHSETVPLTSAALVLEDSAGNKTEYSYTFASPLYGKKAEVINARNENGYPVRKYGEPLNFSVPVKLDGTDCLYAVSYESVSIYSDGITQITFTDLFGESFAENILSDIYGAAFAHNLKFIADGNEITPQTKVCADVTVTVDTGKTNGLSIDGGSAEFTFTENGILNYSLTNSELGQTKTFNVPITNIDKTSPEAIISFNTESETDIETGKRKIYSATYTIEGFSEDGVTLIPSEDGAAPSSVTFEYGVKDKEYTFRFRDEAGNEGSYTADVSDIVFSQRTDNKITDYRLTYMVSDNSGFRTIGEFKANEEVNLELVNKAVSVKIDALNKDGDIVSSEVLADGNLPDGVAVYAKEKLVMFTAESNEKRVVKLTLTGEGSGNSINAAVVLPPNTIDMTAPTGTVNYKTDGNSVKAYLITNDTDIAQNGVYVVGTKADNTAFELKSDENGYYTEFDINGVGRFVMVDNAGNIGTVSIAVLTIDKEPPKIVSEGWQSIADAKDEESIKELLSTPTNNTIKLFITFNEQLKGAEVKAYKDKNTLEELTPTDDYITAVTGGNSLTVEFKQNCLASLSVYDLRDNVITLWRPEDGPISVIDRDVPKPATGYPKRITDNNTVKIEYVFADGEEVMLLQEYESGYKNSHTVIFTENGTQILNFADKAGNVYSDYPVISEIDSLAPNIKMNVDYVGDGKELSGNDSYKAGNLYTSKNVRILLNVDDDTKDGISVTASTKSGAAVNVKAETVNLNGKSYNYNFIVSENGSYKVTAKDKWGNENSVETSVSVIDRTAPTIKFTSSAAVVKTGTTESEAKSKILENTKAVDLQSGANSPVGDKFGTVTDGVTLDVDLSKVKLDKEGIYTAKITASDRLGNTSEKDCTVRVLKDIYTFNIGGLSVYANDVFTASKGTIRIDAANETAKYYYAQGYKSAAQMKYAKGFDPQTGFDAREKGYYTVLAQETGRKMYLLYVYIN